MNRKALPHCTRRHFLETDQILFWLKNEGLSDALRIQPDDSAGVVFENRSAADVWSVSTASAENRIRWPSGCNYQEVCKNETRHSQGRAGSVAFTNDRAGRSRIIG
jgi:hypothetical protein